MKKITFLFLAFISIVFADSVSDLCYEEPTFSGTMCIDIGSVNGGVNCTQTTVIKNLSNDKLTNVKIVLDISGLSGNVFSDCGIDGESKKNYQCKETSAYDFGPVGILNQAVVYDPMPDFNGHDNHSIYIYSLVGGSLFSDYTLYTTYNKNGKTYTGVILPCSEVENNLSEVEPVCNVYTNVLQTRNDNSKITMSDTGQKGFIENTSNYYLNTSYVYRDNYGHGLICDTNGNYQKDPEEFMAEETGHYGASLDVNYSFNVESADVSSSPASSWASDETVDEDNEELDKEQYDKITQDYHKYNFSLTYNGDKKINTFDKILNTVTFKNNTGHDIDIGYFRTDSYSTTNIIFDSIPKNINIYELNTTGSNELNVTGFNASESIKIHNLVLESSHEINLTISAPKVVIDNLLSTNNDNTVIIYANEIDIGNIEFAQNSKFIIYPYTTGTNIIFKSNSITASSSSTMLVSSGNYYTNKFSIPGSRDVSSIRAIDSNQIINFYINGDFKPGNNPGINSLGNGGNFGDLPPENFRLYINGDLDSGNGNDDTGTTFNALVYVEKSTNLGTSTYLRGALSSGDSIVVSNNSKFYWVASIDNSGWDECTENSGSIATGSFNVVHYQPNITDDPVDVNDSINALYTQIVNKEFNVSVVKLKDDNHTVDTNYMGLVEVDLINTPYNQNQCKTNVSLWKSYVLFDKNVPTLNIKYNKANKDVVFRIKYLTDGNGNIIEDTNNACLYKTYNCVWGLLTQIATSRYGNSCPTGSIDENYCNVPCAVECNYKRNQVQGGGEVPSEECLKCIFDNYSQSVCSRDNFAIRPDRFEINVTTSQPIRAGREFNITIKALDYDGNPTTDYNETLTIKGNSPTLEYEDTNISKGCITGNLIGGEVKFKNGEANVSLMYTEAGDLNITVKEVNGSEYADVDANDSANPNGLFIAPSSQIITFIPDHFKINAFYYNFNNSNFTYISNDLNMSSILNMNITAENEQNQTTKNYNSKCYARNFDVNISHSVPSELNATNTLILYKIENGNENNVTLNNNLNLVNLSKNYFSTDYNGSAKFKIYINFEKNYTTPVNEFNFTINDINVSDEDNVTGTKNLDQNVTFRYGRIDVKNVSGYGNELNTTFKYEYWTNNGWVVNKEHNSSIFGDVNKTKSYYPTKFITITLGNISNGEENVTLSTTHALPYSAKIHLSIPSWLWYHPLAKPYKDPSSTNVDCLTHPCIDVSFGTNSNEWFGVSANNDTNYSANKRTSDINSSMSKIKTNKSEVKKLNW